MGLGAGETDVQQVLNTPDYAEAFVHAAYK